MKHFLRPTLMAVALAAALGMMAGVQAQTAKRGSAAKVSSTGTVDKTKASYIIGYQLVGQIPEPMRESMDPAATAKAVQEALSGVKPTITSAEAEAVMKPFMANVQAKAKAQFDQAAAKNKAEGDAFLAKNKSAPGVKTTASGLQYQVISQGTGARPGASDTVTIDYTGTFVNGQVFDASSKHNPPGPASIPLAGVIPGFREGLELMQTGGHYKLFIPASLGYGSQPSGGMPPNMTLIFDVTLVKTGPTPAGATPPPAGAPGG
ncbi:MAG TPA: FKBP-type peptidyl-prolyl cis-trans isomerase [Rhodanobacter sp.]